MMRKCHFDIMITMSYIITTNINAKLLKKIIKNKLIKEK